MEGMVCLGMRRIQSSFSEVGISNIETTRWSCGLITKLLEAAHGQWLYRCVQTHDTISGAAMRKELAPMGNRKTARHGHRGGLGAGRP